MSYYSDKKCYFGEIHIWESLLPEHKQLMGNSERNLPIETLMDIPSFISNVDKYEQAVQDLTIYHTRPSGLF